MAALSWRPRPQIWQSHEDASPLLRWLQIVYKHAPSSWLKKKISPTTCMLPVVPLVSSGMQLFRDAWHHLLNRQAVWWSHKVFSCLMVFTFLLCCCMVWDCLLKEVKAGITRRISINDAIIKGSHWVTLPNSVLARRCGSKGTFAGWHGHHYVYATQYLYCHSCQRFSLLQPT